MIKYYSNAEYKKRHNAYMTTSVKCECGKDVLRCNMTRHRKSKSHKLTMKLYERCTPAEIQKFLQLQQEIEN